MSYNNLNEAIARLDEIEATSAAYSHAMGALSLDAATAAPLGAADGRGKTMAVLSKVVYDLAASAESRELMEYLTEHADELDPEHRRQVEIRKRTASRSPASPRRSTSPSMCC